jgi:hypothetical protein
MSWSDGSQTQQNDLLVAPDHKTASTTSAFAGKMASLIPPPLKQVLAELEQLSVKPQCAQVAFSARRVKKLIRVPNILNSNELCLVVKSSISVFTSVV